MSTKQCIECKVVLPIESFQLRTDTKKPRNQCKSCRNAYVKSYKQGIANGSREKYDIKMVDDKNKQCIKCNEVKSIEDFPCRKTKHGYRHECKMCKQKALSEYYQTTYNAVRRQRMSEDVNRRLIRAQRNYIYKCLTKFKNKKLGSLQYLHCSLSQLKMWLEFQFTDDMSWENYGDVWTVDHVLPLSRFDLTNDKEQYIAFDWKNLQPSKTNFSKSDKLLFSEYLKVTMLAHSFITKNNLKSTGYQGINESLYWLRDKLGYGKNPTDNNGQPATELQNAKGSETIWFWVY
jgi:hypothetical protein